MENVVSQVLYQSFPISANLASFLVLIGVAMGLYKLYKDVGGRVEMMFKGDALVYTLLMIGVGLGAVSAAFSGTLGMIIALLTFIYLGYESIVKGTIELSGVRGIILIALLAAFLAVPELGALFNLFGSFAEIVKVVTIGILSGASAVAVIEVITGLFKK